MTEVVQGSTEEEVVEIPEEVEIQTQEDAKDEVSQAKQLFNEAIKDGSYRERAEQILATADKKLGIVALESPNNYEKGNLIEEILHYMRWNPGYLFDCDLEKLHEYEMALSAHIVFVKAKENHWGVMCDIAKRELSRAIKLAAVDINGKSVGEREALAIATYPQLKTMQKELDVFNLYREKCHGISDSLTQMDNSLKKTLQKRSNEFYLSGRTQQK